MWEAAQRLGIKATTTVLGPAAGIGRFLGLMEVIMKCPSFWISGAASLVLLLSASSGQAQSCLAQLQPLKPVNVICQNAVLSCVCAGTNCHWVWGCPAANPFGVALSAPQITTDPSIILGYKPGKVESPLDLQQKAVDTLIQIQTLKNLQQQNQMMERMNETPPTPSSFIPDPPHPTAPPPAAAPARPGPFGRHLPRSPRIRRTSSAPRS